MDFVKSSVENITDWNQWVKLYVSEKLRETVTKMIQLYPYECCSVGEMQIMSPQLIWVNMLKGDIVVKTIKYKLYRKNIFLDGNIIAVIDKFNKKYKYVDFDYDLVMKKYSEQLF